MSVVVTTRVTISVAVLIVSYLFVVVFTSAGSPIFRMGVP